MVTLEKQKEGIPVAEILWYSCDGMMIIDEYRRILAINPAMEQLLGCRSQEVIGKSDCGILLACRDQHGCPFAEHPEECPGLKAMHQFEPIHSIEYTIRTASGRRIVTSTSYTPIQLPGHPIWALLVIRDITLQKRRERRLARLAATDPLTGLPNRTAILKACSTELKRATRHSRPLTVAMVDIDGFKAYNDQYGHPAGDELLKTLAGLLQIGRRATDWVARYGGDEFALLFPETDVAGALVVAEHLRYLVAKFPFQSAKSPRSAILSLPITISIGVAVFPEDGQTIENLLSQADCRLYQSKHRGGNQVVGPSLKVVEEGEQR